MSKSLEKKQIFLMGYRGAEMKLLVLGAGGHGRVVAEVAEACGYEVSFLDDQPSEGVIGTLSDINDVKERFDEFFVGIGNNSKRKSLQEELEQKGLQIATLVHPTAYVSPTATINTGTIIEPKAIVNTNSVISKGCIISVGAIVDHDAVIGEYAHINAGVICKSGAKVNPYAKHDAGEVVHGFD